MLHDIYTQVGPEACSDTDLIALVLGGGGGRGARTLASDVIDRHGAPNRLLRVAPQRLASVPGLGPHRAVRLHAALALGARAARQVADAPPSITSTADAARWLQPALAGLSHEELHALYLDRRHRPITRRVLSRGSPEATIVDPADIVRPAIELGAAALILAHNHPSGDPEASREDIEATTRVQAGAALFRITLLDHLIIAGERVVSLRERGCL